MPGTGDVIILFFELLLAAGELFKGVFVLVISHDMAIHDGPIQHRVHLGDRVQLGFTFGNGADPVKVHDLPEGHTRGGTGSIQFDPIDGGHKADPIGRAQRHGRWHIVNQQMGRSARHQQVRGYWRKVCRNFSICGQVVVEQLTNLVRAQPPIILMHQIKACEAIA